MQVDFTQLATPATMTRDAYRELCWGAHLPEQADGYGLLFGHTDDGETITAAITDLAYVRLLAETTGSMEIPADTKAPGGHTLMTPEQAEAAAGLLLVRRLIDHRGLDVEDAFQAVAQKRRGQTGPHTHLVAEEAAAVLAEVSAPLRAMFEAALLQMKAAAAAMAHLGPALQRARVQLDASRTGPVRQRDRPAWTSPYGPPARRRTS